jgi:hypothetical protein
MDSERAARIWGLVAERARGAPISPAHICAAAAAGINVDGAGLTVMVGPTRREVVHATDRVADQLEEFQLTFGQGPCMDAFDHGPVLADELEAPGYLARWPAFTPAAIGAGARAVFALPLRVGAIRLGVIDFYRARPGGLAHGGLADALAFADAATTILLDGVDGGGPELKSIWPDGQAGDPAVVHQATGMISVQLGVRVDVAFARLRAYAFAHDRRLRDVARDVVERRLRFEPDEASQDVQ